MKQFFSVLFLFVFFSGLSLAQDAYDKAGVQTGPIVPINTDDPQYLAPAAVLYNNGPLVNAPGGGFGGADASVLQTALTLTLYGYGQQITSNNSIADDFTVGGAGWQVDQMQFFAYQTGSTTTSTINDVRVQIWNGDPTGSGTVIWGDLTTNRLATTAFSNIYRSIDTDPLASNRPIMIQTVIIGTTLSPGTYWVQWMTGGTLTSGPWAPPITINGQVVTGNALQNLAGTWQAALDGTNQQGFPFIVLGTAIPDIAAPVLAYPANNSTEVPTNPGLVWQSATGAETYRLQVSLSSDFISTATNEIDSITGTSFSVSDLAENTKYYWRVRGESGAIVGNWSEVWEFTTVSTITLNYTVTFPSKDKASDYQSSDYKIVGLPGRSDLDVKLILSGTQGTDWQVYWDNGQVDNYYKEYDGTSIFTFGIGRSFWVIRRGNLNISRTVTATKPDINGQVGLVLDLEGEGFNLITNPFTVPVRWADVKEANPGLSGEKIHTYNSGWALDTLLKPYVGYLFDNSAAGLIYLQIPYPFLSKAPLKKNIDLAIWRVEVELTYGEFYDKTTSFGISGEALKGRDKLDFRKPRGMGNTPFVYFYHPEWDNGYGIFETDIRPEFEEEQIWDLKVYSELRESEKLTFSGIEKIPSDMEIYLVDVDRAKYINLRQQEEYEFTAVKTISEFQVLVGKSELINSKLNGILPTEFELGNNFPNPLNPTTTIPLFIPQTADIKLVIYNILGQEVRILFDGTIEPGKYWYQWDGKDNMGQAVPSGIYLYNFFSSTGINLSKKMVLIK